MINDNQCYITGNLGRDPEMKYTQSGRPYCRFSVASSYKTSGSEEHTDWVPVQVWGPLAEACGNQLRKGSRVLVHGKFQTSKYKDGFGKDKYFTQIVAEQVALVLPGSPYGNGRSAQSAPGGQPGTFNAAQFGAQTPQPTTFSDYQQQGGAQQGPEPGVMGPKDEDIPF